MVILIQDHTFVGFRVDELPSEPFKILQKDISQHQWSVFAQLPLIIDSFDVLKVCVRKLYDWWEVDQVHLNIWLI